MELTPDQMKILQEVMKHLRKGNRTLAHISGAAGSGKTLLALCCVYALCEEHLQKLQRQSYRVPGESRKFRVLLLSSSRSTCLFITKWFHKLCPDLCNQVIFYGMDRLNNFASRYRMYLPDESGHILKIKMEHDVSGEFNLVVGEEYHHYAHLPGINHHLNRSNYVVILSDSGQCAEGIDWNKHNNAIEHDVMHFLFSTKSHGLRQK